MALPPDQLEKSQKIIEAALMVAGSPLTPAALQKLFDEGEKPEIAEIRALLKALCERYADSGIELHEVASGWQFRSRIEFAPWLARLSEERPARYSRALLETLALIVLPSTHYPGRNRSCQRRHRQHADYPNIIGA